MINLFGLARLFAEKLCFSGSLVFDMRLAAAERCAAASRRDNWMLSEKQSFSANRAASREDDERA
jgi:hypothetical protein